MIKGVPQASKMLTHMWWSYGDHSGLNVSVMAISMILELQRCKETSNPFLPTIELEAEY